MIQKKVIPSSHVQDIEDAVNKTYSKKRVKLLSEKSKLSTYIIGRIVFDQRWEKFNLAGEFHKWIQKGELEDVSNWLRDNYERLNVDGPKYPYIEKEKENV